MRPLAQNCQVNNAKSHLPLTMACKVRLPQFGIIQLYAFPFRLKTSKTGPSPCPRLNRTLSDKNLNSLCNESIRKALIRTYFLLGEYRAKDPISQGWRQDGRIPFFRDIRNERAPGAKVADLSWGPSRRKKCRQ